MELGPLRRTERQDYRDLLLGQSETRGPRRVDSVSRLDEMALEEVEEQENAETLTLRRRHAVFLVYRDLLGKDEARDHRANKFDSLEGRSQDFLRQHNRFSEAARRPEGAPVTGFQSAPATPLTPSASIRAPRTVDDSQPVALGHTTFRSQTQRDALQTRQNMQARVTATADIDRAEGLSPAVRGAMRAAITSYSVESGYFHYPIRDNSVGQPQIVRDAVCPGIDFTYQTMNKGDNTLGRDGKKVDPFAPVSLNAAMHTADKEPGIYFRGANTVA